jgi:hypothetical protein
VTQCPCDDIPQRVLRIPAGLSVLPRQVQAFPEVRLAHHVGACERSTLTLELLRIGATATKDPVTRAELDRRVARCRIRFLRTAGARLAFTSGNRIPAILRRTGSAAPRHTTLADAGAVGSAACKAIIAIETTRRIRRALAIFAVALARVAALTAVLRIGRRVVARACAATRHIAGATAADSTAGPAGTVGSSRARGPSIPTVGSTRRSGSGVATAGSAIFGSSASPAGRSAVRSAFYAQATATLETGVASAVSASAAFGPSAALRIASSRLGATCCQEQRRREREQPPKTSKHAVLFRLQASHARPAGARHGAAARDAEARR